jgi:two-component system, NarL family, nitrate/nitrite response regulator NarL
MSIRVVIADDHPLLLDGLEAVLGASAEFDVVRRCGNGSEALQAIIDDQPDIAVLDIHMPERSGLQVLAEVRSRGIHTRVVLLTAAISERELTQAMRLDVDGIVLKEMPTRLLMQCLHKVQRGGRWVENRAAHSALEAAIRREAGLQDAASELTRREIELVHLVAQGLRNKEIGRRLVLSECTVKTHLRNIYRKLGIANRVGIRCYAETKGIL